MRRTLTILIIFFVVLPIGYSAGYREAGAPEPSGQNVEVSHYADYASKTDNDSHKNSPGAGQLRGTKRTESKVTVFFAGLIYFRHKSTPYKACVLRQIPNHEFRVFASGYMGKIKVDKFLKEGNEWHLEVITAYGVKGGAKLQHLNGKFDRKNFKHPATDYRWIVDFDDLHPGYRIDDDALLPVIEIPAGDFYTLCRTTPLDYTKGGKDKGEFGAMADITGVDLTLNPGEKLVLRTDDNQKIIELNYQAGTTRYIAFLNLPPDEMLPAHSKTHLKRARRLAADDDLPTHFLNYYLLIHQPFDERYDFQLRGSHTECELPEGVKGWIKNKLLLSPPPYYCGTGGGKQ